LAVVDPQRTNSFPDSGRSRTASSSPEQDRRLHP
jgi:hypothetical protein